MSEEMLSYEIKEVGGYDGLRLELWIEGHRIANATALPEILAEMEQKLGLAREDVAEELRISLRFLLKHQLEAVELSEPEADEGEDNPLLFESSYKYFHRGNIDMKLVWYDVGESTTGPDGVPAVVRNKMRHAVHKKLTGDDSLARELVELSQQEQD